MARKITLKLYATLGDRLPAGAYENAAEVEVADDATLNEIIDRFRVPRALAHLVLINGNFVCAEDRDTPGRLRDGDTLAIWPPVAGGSGRRENIKFMRRAYDQAEEEAPWPK